jgi:hypothetical protein
MSTADDLDRIKRYGYGKFWLNVAAYALTSLLAWLAISYIPIDTEGAERKGYYVAILAVAYLFGRFLNWFVLMVFKQDISK